MVALDSDLGKDPPSLIFAHDILRVIALRTDWSFYIESLDAIFAEKLKNLNGFSLFHFWVAAAIHPARISFHPISDIFILYYNSSSRFIHIINKASTEGKTFDSGEFITAACASSSFIFSITISAPIPSTVTETNTTATTATATATTDTNAIER